VIRKLLIGLGLLVALVGVLVLAAPFVLRPPKVPPQAIATSVTHTPSLIERAWALPVAAAYKHRVTWQSNGSVCGPASLGNVFRSLGEPASDEAKVLAGTGLCWTGMCFMGLTLDQLAGVARAHTKRSVTVLRDLTPETFLEHMKLSNDPKRRYTVNFTRKVIFGAGGGHHSPVAGYLEPEDLVFVLDVNHDFQPWLIERSRLFAAVDTRDGDKKRGLLLIQ
jgi:phytochelatin synthase